MKASLPPLPWHLCLLLASLMLGQASVANELLQGDLGTPASAPGNQFLAPPSSEAAETPEPPAPRLSPADAARLVRTQTGGQVMSVSTLRSDTGTVYRVKILNAGRMRIVQVDGQTGELLSP